MPLYEAYLSHLVFLTHILKLVIDLCAALCSVLVPIFYISAWSVRLRKFNTATCTTFREPVHGFKKWPTWIRRWTKKRPTKKRPTMTKTTGDGFLWPQLNWDNKGKLCVIYGEGCNDQPKNDRPWQKRPATYFCDRNSPGSTRENGARFMERAVRTSFIL